MAKFNIWIVEDDPAMRDLIALGMSRYGYNVESFTDGAVPLEMIGAGEVPDLLLLDIMLPQMDGLDILRQLRETWEPADVPVIILSAKADRDSIVKGLETGANDYVTKPYHPEELHSRIQTHLHIKQLMQDNREALRQLQELDEFKDQAMLVASHDLKGQVGSIMAGLQLLGEGVRPAEGEEEIYRMILQSVMRSAEMMAPIIDGFLNLQAVKARRLGLAIEPVCLNRIVETVVMQYRNLGQEKNVKIKLDLNETLPECLGDPLSLKQVVGNLLSNAVKYSPPGESIRIRTRHVRPSVRVEVEDHGPGIAPENIPRLFEMFTPLSPNSGENKGTGVGLYISRQMIEMQRGKMEVESVPDIGTVFWFQLPEASNDIGSPEDHPEAVETGKT